MYLKSYVYLEASEGVLDDKDHFANLKKDMNYVVAKRLIGHIGGKIHSLNQGKTLLVMIVMPLDQQFMEAFIDKSHPDHQFWRAKQNAILQSFN